MIRFLWGTPSFRYVHWQYFAFLERAASEKGKTSEKEEESNAGGVSAKKEDVPDPSGDYDEDQWKSILQLEYSTVHEMFCHGSILLISLFCFQLPLVVHRHNKVYQTSLTVRPMANGFDFFSSLKQIRALPGASLAPSRCISDGLSFVVNLHHLVVRSRSAVFRWCVWCTLTVLIG